MKKVILRICLSINQFLSVSLTTAHDINVFTLTHMHVNVYTHNQKRRPASTPTPKTHPPCSQ